MTLTTTSDEQAPLPVTSDLFRQSGGNENLWRGPLMADDDYVYDEATGEWLAPSDAVKESNEVRLVRDAAGNTLSDGDAVVLIKDLKVKGAGQTLKQGTVIRSIRLTADSDEIDCRHDTIKGLVLRTEFVRKR